MGPGGLGFLTPSWRKNMARRRIWLGSTGRRSFGLHLPHIFAEASHRKLVAADLPFW
jgi:hypothetical protein